MELTYRELDTMSDSDFENYLAHYGLYLDNPDGYLAHYGVKGMKWGVRKNSDGAASGGSTDVRKNRLKQLDSVKRGVTRLKTDKELQGKVKKAGVAVAVVGASVAAGYLLGAQGSRKVAEIAATKEFELGRRHAQNGLNYAMRNLELSKTDRDALRYGVDDGYRNGKFRDEMTRRDDLQKIGKLPR